MEKENYILYWKNNASKDWKRVSLLLKNRDYVFSLFCVHLTLEKLFKAHWVKDNISNHPPKIHNLVFLRSQTSLMMNDNDVGFLEQMNLFQIEGRYPDYQNKLYHLYKETETKQIILRADKIRKWLIKNL